MSHAKTPQAIIPLITRTADYPVPVSDRFGEFEDLNHMDQFWLKDLPAKNAPDAKLIRSVLTGLHTQYDNSGPLLTGDPRLFMAEEMTFIAHGINAIGKHSLGVHAEFELDTDDATDEEINQLVTFWQDKMHLLDGIYRHTTFFLAMGGMTYNDRLTLNAFTPLKNGRIEGVQLAPEHRYLMISPYHAEQETPALEACPTLNEIVQTLIQMGLHDLDALEAVTAAREYTRKLAA